MAAIDLLSSTNDAPATDAAKPRQGVAAVAAEQTAQAIRVLLDNLGEAVYLVGADGRVAAYNTRFGELFDLPPDAVKVGADPLELVEYLNRQGEFARDANYAIATGAITHCLTQPFEEIHRRPDERILKVTGRPIPSGGCTVSFIDITEQRRTLATLEEREQQLQTLIDNLPGMVFQLVDSPDGTRPATYFSAGMRRIVGVSMEELAAEGRAYEELIHPEDRARKARAFSEAASRGEQVTVRYRVQARPDNTTKWLEVRATPHALPDGSTRWNGVALDITNQRATEESLLQATKLEAIGRLTGGVAHDFNNLLAVILGDAELLQERLRTLDPMLRERADSIVDAVDKGAHLVQSLLSFARRQPLAPQPINVNKLIGDFAPLLRRTLGEDIDLALDLSPEACIALADGHQFETALLNLAINSRDAMSRGGRLMIATRNQVVDRPAPEAQSGIAPSDYVCVSITDNGCGIPRDYLSKVVEPFFTTKAVGKGSGLGLSMVYGFAQQSGGRLDITSEVGLGTTVSLYLPRAGTDHGSDGGEARDALLRGQERDVMPRGTERVLLVEDDDHVRDTVLNLFSALGYTVVVAASGLDALAILKSGQRFDLLFSDIVLPGGMTGVEMADQAKALAPDMEVMFTSGYSDAELMHDGRLDPGVRLLQKPFRRRDLARAVRAVLDAGPDARRQP